MSDPVSTAEPASLSDPALLAKNPWGWWRAQMPIAEDWAYLDHAAVGPLSGPAAEAITQFADQASRFGDTVWPQWNAAYENLRHQAASWINSSPEEICLIPNTTTGVNLVAAGWPFQPGDNVVIPDGEFPSNLFPWMHQSDRGVQLRVVPRRGIAVEVDDLMDHTDSSTRIIAVSWVGFASGYRVDLDELVAKAHARGIAVFVDAIQGMGMFPLDVRQTPVDFLAIDGHKWMLGPEGIGFAYVASRHLERLRSTNVGWASVKESHNYSNPSLELKPSAARFESGSANMVGAAALGASFDLFHQVRAAHGERAIADRVLQLTGDLAQRLRAAGARFEVPQSPHHPSHDHRSGIVNFQLSDGSPETFRHAALAEKVVVSCRGGGIRASVHAYNNTDDLQRLVDVIPRAQTLSTKQR